MHPGRFGEFAQLASSHWSPGDDVILTAAGGDAADLQPRDLAVAVDLRSRDPGPGGVSRTVPAYPGHTGLQLVQVSTITRVLRV